MGKHHKYNIEYFLCDGIYPKCATFVKTIRFPQGPKAKLFVARQESVRKDVKRAFGVLEARFAIICGPAQSLGEGWLRSDNESMCHTNMIVEDKRDSYGIARPDKSDPNRTTRNQTRTDMRKNWTDFYPKSEIEPTQNRTEPIRNCNDLNWPEIRHDSNWTRTNPNSYWSDVDPNPKWPKMN